MWAHVRKWKKKHLKKCSHKSKVSLYYVHLVWNFTFFFRNQKNNHCNLLLLPYNLNRNLYEQLCTGKNQIKSMRLTTYFFFQRLKLENH